MTIEIRIRKVRGKCNSRDLKASEIGRRNQTGYILLKGDRK